MTDRPPPDPGFCVCGKELPEQPLSDWACSEPCQSAWMQHHADPGYPHPRDIRDAAARRAAGLRRPRPPVAVEQAIAEGTEIDVDGHAFVRVGIHWQPAGMWHVFRDGIADIGAYRRWCPRCQQRVDSLIYPATDRQECASCGHQWPGRPLLGQFERRDGPWPGVRIRLFDGQRSAVFAFFEEALAAFPDTAVDVDRLGRWWLRLERQLCGGYADADEPDDRQRLRQERRLRRDWHFCVDLTT